MKFGKIQYKIKKIWEILIQARFLMPMGMAALLKDIYPLSYNNIWLVGANDDKFENNIRAFYLYLRDHTNTDVFWVANRKNVEHLKQLGVRNVLVRGSFKNYLLAANAKVAVYCHNDSDVAVRYYRYFKHHTLIVNIGHGYNSIKKAPVPYFHWPADIIVAASQIEKNIIMQSGVSTKKIQITGFPRLDYFEIQKARRPIQNILLMPTWRDWYMDGNYDLKNMELFVKYSEMIHAIKEVYNRRKEKVEFKFVFHPMFARYFEKFKDKYSFEDTYILSDTDSTQEAMKNSDLLITDYSSVSMDYIYMNKPLILYWFDYEKYNKERGIHLELLPHLGDIVCYDAANVAKCVEKYMEEDWNFGVDREYFYRFNDKNNCKRLYRYLDKCAEKKYRKVIK